ncbi:MAG: TlyA family rRNA (cytidine-2'-O)-methyltransferase [Spirochaetaceae bacterium]|nr:MAG: TlyA family rRNA (cytidine-2'-O)-methyltransferase [Spirochaetaceae bacterium]
MTMIPLLRLLCERFPDVAPKELHARILCGEVLVNGDTERDPARTVSDDSAIEWRVNRYVSRGGLKLEAALSAWRLPVLGRVFVDAGASTGGFTDCLLHAGAERVHAVDVGYNQLDYRLRQDRRVVVHERTNIMSVAQLDPRPHAGVADLSFRSLKGAAHRLLQLTTERWAVVLVKPQFELPAGDRTFDGVIRDRTLLLQTLLRVVDTLSTEDVAVVKTMPSPVVGRRGNREFLFLVAATGTMEADVADVADQLRLQVEQIAIRE